VLGILVIKRFPLPLPDVTIMNRRIIFIALLTCKGGLALIAFPFVDAAPPDSDATHEHDETRHMPLEMLSSVTGKVASWTTNKGGDVDGFKFSENAVVHFPPHHGEQVSAWLKLEDDVTVFAKPKSRPDGTEVMEAVVLQRGEEAMPVPGPKPHHIDEAAWQYIWYLEAMQVRAPKPHHPKPHGGKPGPGHAGDHEEQPMSVHGKVTELHENREGVVDGFKVDAKTEVKFPPHQSEAVLASIQVGGEVVVEGRRHETPKGDIHLHANRVSSGDAVFEIDRPEPKKHEVHPPHGKKGPEGPKGPKRPNGREGDKEKDGDHGKPPHVQIVDELRKIRELLEEQGSR